MFYKALKLLAGAAGLYLAALILQQVLPSTTAQLPETSATSAQKVTTKANRAPASSQKHKPSAISSYKVAAKDEKLVKSQEAEVPSLAAGKVQTPAETPFSSWTPFAPTKTPSVKKTTPPQATSKKEAIRAFSNVSQQLPPQAAPNADVVVVNNDIPGGVTDNSNTSIICSASTGGGTYSTSRNITLVCSASATIKYCVSENVCCDPASGTTYTSAFTIGENNKTFCLSFIGEDAEGNESSEVQLSYTFNATAPHLVVTHPKIQYQTTELLGKAVITSNDFGDAGFELAQLNLKSHDPGPAGLNYDCDDIVANAASLVTPTPSTILGPLSAASFTAAQQVENLLDTTKLVYGDNFITTLMSNVSFTDEVHSCATTKVVLQDFEYFQPYPLQAEAGSTTVREFEGGFSAYGFFEEPSDVYRGPAGISVKVTGDQELRSGILGVMY